MKAIPSRIDQISALLLTTAVIISGCASKPPTFQEGPDAEVSFDGLIRVDNTAFKKVWADPDADLSVYTKIIPIKAEIEFRAVKSSSRGSSKSEFPIDENARIKIIDTIAQVLSEEIGDNKRFAITDKPAPDTLILAVSLLDIVSNAPPELIGRGDVFLSRVGEITLVLELKDSQSGETLLRAAERGAVEPAGNRGLRSNSVTNMNELRRLARRWGTKITAGLESL
jgi:hypothetical protein